MPNRTGGADDATADGTFAAVLSNAARWCLLPISIGDVVARGTRSRVHAYGRGAVAKVPVPSTPDDWIRYEAQYADAVRAAGAPAPRLLGLEQIGGRTASIWEQVGGTSMWQLVVDRPGQTAALGRMLADIQQSLLVLVPPVTLPRQRDRLASKIRRTAATVDAGLAPALGSLPPDVAPMRLCHGDLHPSNVILARDGPVLVDWFDASRGDPLADVARSLVTLLSDGPSLPAHLPGSDRATVGVLTHAYVDRLRDHIAIDDALLARWQAVSAVARMAEGVPSRALREVWTRYADPGRAQTAAN
jgi:aminoglycoside phosphotransferase (APT) family kinase protein